MMRRQRPGDSEFIDASPGGDDPYAPDAPPPTGRELKSRNLQETKVWKDSVGGAKSLWHTYLNILSTRFRNTPRKGQEEFILRMSQTFTIGSAILVLGIIYPWLPQQVRIFVLPLVLGFAWWLGTRMVASQMIIRFEKYLNPHDNE